MSSSSSEYPLGLNETAYNGVIQFGILAQSLFPEYHDMNMTAAVDQILERGQNGMNLTEIFMPDLIRVGQAHMNPSPILGLLQMILKDVPHTNGDKGLVDSFIAIFVVTMACVFLRLYQRYFYMPGGLQPEDWAMAIAMGPVVGLNIVFILLSSKGYGSLSIHIWDVSFNEFLRCMRYLFASEIVYPFALFAVRHSLHLFYLRLTAARKAMRLTIHALIATNLACLIFSVVTIIFQCRGMVDWWNDPLKAYCPDRSLLFLLGGIFIIVTDVATVLLAVPLIYNIKMPLRKKILVCFIFSLGFVACSASINRVIRVKKFFEIQSNLGDVTYESAHITSGIWSLLEVDLAVMVGCVPALKSFVLQAVENRRRKFAALNRSKSNDGDSIGSLGRWPWLNKIVERMLIKVERMYSAVVPSSMKSGASRETTLVGTGTQESVRTDKEKNTGKESEPVQIDAV